MQLLTRECELLQTVIINSISFCSRLRAQSRKLAPFCGLSAITKSIQFPRQLVPQYFTLSLGRHQDLGTSWTVWEPVIDSRQGQGTSSSSASMPALRPTPASYVTDTERSSGSKAAVPLASSELLKRKNVAYYVQNHTLLV